MNTIKLLRNLAKYFPKSLKEHGDHVGLMYGKLKDDTKKIVLCLDFDDYVLDIMKKNNIKPDLILTHHPFIYGTKFQVLSHDLVKKALCDKLDKINIPVYSMHTNFDTGKGGMNDAIAEALGLTNIRPLETCKMARGGELPHEMEIHEFSKFAIKALNLDYAHLVHAGKDKVKTVAVVGGGGSYKYRNAREEGYDIYLSGDAPHHIRREVMNNHYNFLVVAHEVERIFMPQMKKILLSIDPTLDIEIINHEELPELIIN